MRRKIAAGNWKMNGLREALAEVQKMGALLPQNACEVILCPPATLIRSMEKRCREIGITIGGQDCHENIKGAHTGDISAEMLADTGAQYVILGHSERRVDYGESDALVQRKTLAAWAAGLNAIVCIGESEAQRDAGKTLDIIGAQLAGSVPDDATAENLVIAYEPNWAIGTGRVPSNDEIAEVHAFIRAELNNRFGKETGEAVRILYGGSMNPKNVDDLSQIPNVDGGLVGGASLKADDFSQIINALS